MKWFKEKFLPSFKECNGKRISEKQYNIFEKYLKKYLYKDASHDNCFKYEYHFENVIIITESAHAGYGKGWNEYYLTIK